MTYRISRYFKVVLLTACFFTKSHAQSGLCPSNLDFEQGDFSGWICKAGTVFLDGSGLNAINWTSIGPPVPTFHTMITAPGGVDFYGGFSESCPNGSGFSIRLGNQTATSTGGIGREASGVTYTYTIPASATNFSILFHYAIVLHDGSHGREDQSRFRARIRDVSTGMLVPCADFDFIVSSSLGGFNTSPVNSQVKYKEWTPVSLDLSGMAGRTVELEFITTECTLGGHFAYAYIDVNSNCNGAITGNYICPGEPGITLTAPFGFQGYRWFDGPGFANVIGTGQSLTLNPAPSVGSVFPVEITPFTGFGCLDTLYAIVDVATAPVADAGPDRVICNGQTVQIGSPPLTAHTYSWIPAGLVSNPNVSNPWAGPVSVPTDFTVTVTDILTGCTNSDIVTVSQTDVDTTVTLTGDNDFCISDPGGTLSVNNSSTTVQWYEATTGLIPGATGLTYVPTVTGTYWASMTQSGCLDSSGNHAYIIRPLPTAAFTPDNDSGCIARSTITFTNGSTTPDNSNMTYLWRYSDGVTDISTDAVRVFPAQGTYNVKLVTTTEHGCKDSTNQDVFVMPLGVPDFTWDSICTTRPVQFRNLSDEANSPQTWYSWDFGNGDPPVTVKDPPMVVYNDPPGQLNVTLRLVSLGCETDTQTVVKTVQVNKQAPGIRYRTFTIPEGSTHWMHVRDSIGDTYNWRPRMYLSSYDTRYTQFTAVDDVDYRIEITDIHTCVTVDSMQLLVLKKPGFYLPTAFTPNGDGLNDVIRPYLIGMKGLKSFSIFNRGGQLVYFSKNYGEGWDGKFKGEDQATGVFVWVLEFYDSNNKLVLEKGTLTLIR